MAYVLSRKYSKTLTKIALIIGLLSTCAHAELTPDLKNLERQLHYQQGTIKLLNGSVVINTGDKFRYLSPQDSEKVLVDGWGNPPSDELGLGMLVPADLSPLEDSGWGAELSFEDDAYISDDDAKTIDYNKILLDMKQQISANNIERQHQGYDPLYLLGWAETPHYDQSSHIIYWAKRLSNSPDPTTHDESVNYFIRNLGRNGVFNINIIADGKDLSTVKKSAPDLLKVASFTEGNRYEDHHFWDTTSSYSLAALVAGGAAVTAKKAGLIGLIIIFLKKFFVVILAAVGGLWKAISGKKK